MRGATGSIYTLAEGEGKPIEAGASFTRDPGNRETLAASLEHTPDIPGGEEVATSELRFNEEFGISYQTLRDDAFSITNGTVTKARRLTQGSNLRWEIHVGPASNADVTAARRSHRTAAPRGPSAPGTAGNCPTR